MSHQTVTINQPDNAWSTRLKQQLTAIAVVPDVFGGELDIGRTTFYKILSGETLPRAELWQRILRQIVLHPRSALSWGEVLSWDAAWAALSAEHQPTAPYQLLGQIFESIPPGLVVQMVQYLSAQPDDRVALPLIRDYQSHRTLNQAALQDLQNWLTEQERRSARDEISQLLPKVRQTITENQHWLTQHQQRLADIDQFAVQLTRFNEEMSMHTNQLLALAGDVAELNAWRAGVNRSIMTLDQKMVEVSLPALWNQFWVACGIRWYGPWLQDRWHRPIEVLVGLLVLTVVTMFYNLMPVPYRDNAVIQGLLLTLLMLIVAWETVRTQLRETGRPALEAADND